MVGYLVFNGSFSTERLFSAIMSYNVLYKHSFIYCSTEEGFTLRKKLESNFFARKIPLEYSNN